MIKKRQIKGSLGRLLTVVMFTGLLSGAPAAFGDTGNKEEKTTVIDFEEKKDDIMNNIDEMCESLKKDLKLDSITSEEEQIRAEEFLKLVRENVGNESSEMNEDEARFMSMSSGTGQQPTVLSYRKGYIVYIFFFDIGCDRGKDIQIWGKNGKNHFLIKDYGKTIPGRIGYRLYKWNITDFNGDSPFGINPPIESVGKNISSKNQSRLQREYDMTLDNIGIYVTSRSRNSCGEPLSYYKNFSLIERDEFKGANMITSYDDPEVEYLTSYDITRTYLDQININQNTEFPAVAVKDRELVIGLYRETGDELRHYEVYIKGWNDGESYKVKLEPESDFYDLNKKIYRWIPEYDGVFNIVAEEIQKGENIPVIVRRVFVRKEEETGYLGITNLEVTENGDDVVIQVETENFDKDASVNNSQVALRVGEESMWSKTLKNYKDTTFDFESTGLNENGSTEKITMSEAKNNFEMSKGEYFIEALVKKDFSAEYEDISGKMFTKEEYNCEKLFKITSDYTPETGYIGKTYEFKIEATPEFEAILEGEGLTLEGLEYAMLIWDYRGKRVVNSYEVNKTEFSYEFRDPGEYKIFLRARIPSDFEVKNGIRYLKNSYIDEVSVDVKIPMMYRKSIEINSVTLENFDISNYSEDGFVKEDTKTFYKSNSIDGTCIQGGENLQAHSKNRIIIDADYLDKDDNPIEKSRLMYKVYAIHDGIWESLTTYTTSNVISFYPRSEGKYKLLVLVKDSVSGSEEDRLIIEVTAKNSLINP